MTAKLIQELYLCLEGSKPRLEGWCSFDKAMALMATAWALRPAVAVEIGVWSGRSALPVALVLREVGKGILYAIDPWAPAASCEGYSGANHQWWATVANHQYAKNQFDYLVNKCGLFHMVKIQQQRSDAVMPPDVIDLLHIDGQHTEQARRDVARFGSKVRVGGFCFMDDVAWANDGRRDVGMACGDLVALGFCQLYQICGDSDCEVYQRIK